MGVYYEFDEVDAFTVGAVGEPGRRVFYLQARRGSLQIDVKCEKQQVAAIVEYLRGVLNDLPEVPMGEAAAGEFAQPGEPSFVLGPVGLGYDRANDRVLVQLEEVVLSDDDDEGEEELDRGHLRVFLTRAQASGWCLTADAVVAAGRPPCPWCDGPLDPAGHVCPRMN